MIDAFEKTKLTYSEYALTGPTRVNYILQGTVVHMSPTNTVTLKRTGRVTVVTNVMLGDYHLGSDKAQVLEGSSLPDELPVNERCGNRPLVPTPVSMGQCPTRSYGECRIINSGGP